jgi:hypothetical protein
MPSGGGRYAYVHKYSNFHDPVLCFFVELYPDDGSGFVDGVYWVFCVLGVTGRDSTAQMIESNKRWIMKQDQTVYKEEHDVEVAYFKNTTPDSNPTLSKQILLNVVTRRHQRSAPVHCVAAHAHKTSGRTSAPNMLDTSQTSPSQVCPIYLRRPCPP